uniref:G-protein coupled receptors family 1 profile domain-containing protein n=1 Tax=Plectus sambesii TaxID=2011161 RepID=A0A914WLE3_9BILA
MVNISLNSSSEENFTANVHLYWIYVGQGLFLMVANVLIIGAIAFHEPLRQRKEYIVIAGLAFVDISQGFGFFTAGLIRNVYIIEGTAGKLVSRVACLVKPWNMAFMWRSQLLTV